MNVVANVAAGIRCEKCGERSEIVRTMAVQPGQVRRYRRCKNPACRHKWVTEEKNITRYRNETHI